MAPRAILQLNGETGPWRGRPGRPGLCGFSTCVAIPDTDGW